MRNLGVCHGMLKMMENFQNVLQECKLLDIGLWGYPYTWSNKHIGRYFVQGRLDHVLCSCSQENLGLFSSVSHLVSWCSDHCLILLMCKTTMTHEQHSIINTGFHYEVFWKEYAECGDIIADCWKVSIDVCHDQDVCDDQVSLFRRILVVLQ